MGEVSAALDGGAIVKPLTDIEKFNDLVEYADFVTDGQFDTKSPEVLADGLQSRGFYGVARMLRLAGQPLGYFSQSRDSDKKRHYRTCGTHQGKACTCATIQGKAHDALFPVDKISGNK